MKLLTKIIEPAQAKEILRVSRAPAYRGARAISDTFGSGAMIG